MLIGRLRQSGGLQGVPQHLPSGGVSAQGLDEDAIPRRTRLGQQLRQQVGSPVRIARQQVGGVQGGAAGLRGEARMRGHQSGHERLAKRCHAIHPRSQVERVLFHQQLHDSLRILPQQRLRGRLLCQQAGQSQRVRGVAGLRLPQPPDLFEIDQFGHRPGSTELHHITRRSLLQVVQQQVAGRGVRGRENECRAGSLGDRRFRIVKVRPESLPQEGISRTQRAGLCDRLGPVRHDQPLDLRHHPLTLLQPDIPLPAQDPDHSPHEHDRGPLAHRVEVPLAGRRHHPRLRLVPTRGSEPVANHQILDQARQRMMARTSAIQIGKALQLHLGLPDGCAQLPQLQPAPDRGDQEVVRQLITGIRDGQRRRAGNGHVIGVAPIGHRDQMQLRVQQFDQLLEVRRVRVPGRTQQLAFTLNGPLDLHSRFGQQATQNAMGSFGVPPMTLVRGFQIESLFQEVQPEAHSPILTQQRHVAPGPVFDHLGQQRELHADHAPIDGQGLDGGGQKVVLAGRQ